MSQCNELTSCRYADSAKRITNAAKINIDPKDSTLLKLKEELDRLKEILTSQGGGNPAADAILQRVAGQAGIDPAMIEELKKQQQQEVEKILAQKGLAEEVSTSLKCQAFTFRYCSHIVTNSVTL